MEKLQIVFSIKNLLEPNNLNKVCDKVQNNSIRVRNIENLLLIKNKNQVLGLNRIHNKNNKVNN